MTILKPLYVLGAVMLGTGFLLTGTPPPASAESYCSYPDSSYILFDSPDCVEPWFPDPFMNGWHDYYWNYHYCPPDPVRPEDRDWPSCPAPPPTPNTREWFDQPSEPEAEPCPDGQERTADGQCPAPAPQGCPPGKDDVNGQCLNPCPDGQSRNSGGECVAPPGCPPGQEIGWGGQCEPIKTSEGCPPGKEDWNGQCVDPCPEGMEHEWGVGCVVKKESSPPASPPSQPQNHGCQLWPFPPKPFPIGTPCPLGMIDTGPM